MHKPRIAAHDMLQCLDALGVRYLLGNGGTDFPPLIKAYAEASETGGSVPEPMTITHENLAVSMAHGYYLACGELAAVMVHVSVGTANTLCGLMNAARDQVPILLLAGRTPIGDAGVLGARNAYIHWAQESFDQGGLVREFVKWDYEVRGPEQVALSLARAAAIAQADPCGPVYVTLPREHLAAAVDPDPAARRPISVTAVPPASANSKAIEQVKALLASAERPLLITSATGRSDEGFNALADFSAWQQVPVVEFRPRVISMSADHPNHAGFDPHRLLPDSDLVLIADVDVPWIPSTAALAKGVPVVALGTDPIHQNYPYWSFSPDIALSAASAGTLAALAAAAPAPKDRTAWLRRAARRRGSSTTFDFARATELLAEALPEAIFVNENPLDPSRLGITGPGRYFASSPAGGLGWGLGAALGVKLARSDALVVCAVGDGAYMFGGPTPFHYTSRRYGLPVLTIVFNNKRWGGVRRSTQHMYGQEAGQWNQAPFIDLTDPPDYGMICRSCGGEGFTASTAEQLADSLSRARDIVQSGRQALIDLAIDGS